MYKLILTNESGEELETIVDSKNEIVSFSVGSRVIDGKYFTVAYAFNSDAEMLSVEGNLTMEEMTEIINGSWTFEIVEIPNLYPDDQKFQIKYAVYECGIACGNMRVGSIFENITFKEVCEIYGKQIDDKDELGEAMSYIALSKEDAFKQKHGLENSFSSGYVLEYKKYKILKKLTEKKAEKLIKKLNETTLKNTKFTVELNRTSEEWENEEDEDDPYNGEPMYEAYLNNENGEQIDATGRYCCFDSVMSDLVELLEKRELLSKSAEMYQTLKF